MSRGATTTVDPRAADHQANRAAMLARLAEVEAAHGQAAEGGGERYVARHQARGRLLVRDRIDRLVDPDSPFLELSPLAGWGTDDPLGGGLVTGIGLIEGTECVISANDPTVRGGTSSPTTVAKGLRAQEVAASNRLPLVNLTESGGADLPRQAEIFVPGGATFKGLTRLSAAGIPTITLVFGSSTAGGAYVPGLSDYTVLVADQAQVFLGGPPLVKMAIDEDADEEALGGAAMHARTSGLADFLAVDEVDALRLGRRIVARLGGRRTPPRPEPGPPPRLDPDELLGIVGPDVRTPFDVREILWRVVDDSAFDEFKPDYGSQLVCGWADLCGYRIGVLANNGILFSPESQKGAQFIQLCNRSDTPLLFVQNITGFMVGTEAEQGGIVKHGSQLINAVSNSTVPHLTLMVGASYGAGNYAMSGRAYDPRFVFSWPSHRLAVMGPRQLAGVLSIVSRDRSPAGRAPVRRGGRRRSQPGHRGPDRGRVHRPVRHRPPVGRRHHRSSRHPHRAGPGPVGRARRAGGGQPLVRGVPPVSPTASPRPIHRLLVANRGEIAVRVIDAAHDLGMQAVAVYAEPDRGAPHVHLADVSVALGGSTAAETYLDQAKLLEAALAQGADAVHPGYGFLSEDASFAQAVVDAGLTWVGPHPEAIRTMGDKLAAKRVAAEVGVPVLPSAELDGDVPEHWVERAAGVGYPLLVKAAGGGGGRGMRRCRAPTSWPRRSARHRREAASSFGNPTVFAERWLAAPHHIEVQLVADQHGGIIHLGERECSIQRRHQKLVEECPSPAVDDLLRDRLGAAAVALAQAIAYDSVGTVEFLLDEASGQFWFLEMNTRIQVEHRVTEEVLGCDLVWWQIQTAQGEPLSWSQDRVDVTEAHAIEVRLVAEDPAQDWRGATGVISHFRADSDERVLIDSAVSIWPDGPTHHEVTPHFDPLLAKLVASGYRREVAIGRLVRALTYLEVHGVTTNRDYLLAVLAHPDFQAGRTTTLFVSDHPGLLDAGPRPEVVAEHVIAAWLHQARSRTQAGPWPFAPTGWRVTGRAPSLPRYELAGQAIEARLTAQGDRFQAEVDGVERSGRVLSWADDHLLAEIDGSARCYWVRRHQGTTYVNSKLGQTDLVEVDRFPEPSILARDGGPTAPVPGRVVAVEVAPGQRVEAGQTLVVLESMKVEHRVSAPVSATVAAVLVAVDDVVQAQQLLIRLEDTA